MAVDPVILDPLSVNGWSPSQTFATDITITRSGAEQRVTRWTFPKREYKIPFDVMSRAQFTALRDFHALRAGSGRGFLLWDISNFYVTAAQGNLGNGNGVKTIFQLTRTIFDAGNTLIEPILHPAATSTPIPVNLQGVVPGFTSTFFTVTVNGVAKVEGTDFTVNPANGLVTFTVAPGSALAVVAAYWFFQPVRFTSDEFTMDLDSIYAKAELGLTGLIGE